jgi:hypothetical protein
MMSKECTGYIMYMNGRCHIFPTNRLVPFVLLGEWSGWVVVDLRRDRDHRLDPIRQEVRPAISRKTDMQSESMSAAHPEIEFVHLRRSEWSFASLACMLTTTQSLLKTPT